MRSLLLKSAVSLALLSSVVLAQTGTGTITGIVEFQFEGPASGVVVAAKNLATGVVFQATSAKNGVFTIPDLPAGKYNLTCTVPGYKPYANNNLGLSANQVLKEEIDLAEIPAM